MIQDAATNAGEFLRLPIPLFSNIKAWLDPMFAE